MSDWSQYILRYRSQYNVFRLENETLLLKRSRAYKEWIESLPWMEWVPLRFRSEEEARLVIGIICVLYWDKEINISFSNDFRCIRNEPRTKEELLSWMKGAGWHGKGIDRE